MVCPVEELHVQMFSNAFICLMTAVEEIKSFSADLVKLPLSAAHTKLASREFFALLWLVERQ